MESRVRYLPVLSGVSSDAEVSACFGGMTLNAQNCVLPSSRRKTIEPSSKRGGLTVSGGVSSCGGRLIDAAAERFRCLGSELKKGGLFIMTEKHNGNERTHVNQVPPIPMSGRYVIGAVAPMFEKEVEYFRKWIKARPSIRTIPFGSTIIIDMEWLWEDLIRLGIDPEAKAKATSPKTKLIRPKPRPKIGKKELPLSTVTPE